MLQLIKSVVQIMFFYSIIIYSWSISFLKELEKCFKKFMWSENLEVRKLVVVSWIKVCAFINDGGLR